MLSGLTVLDLNHGELIRRAIGETLHDGTLNDSLPRVGRLHDLDLLIHSVTKTLLQVVGSTETTDQEDSADGNIAGGNLILDESDDLKDNRFEDGLQVGSLESETTTADTQSLVVGETTHGDGVSLVGGSVQSELTFDLSCVSWMIHEPSCGKIYLLLEHFHSFRQHFLIKALFLA